LLAGGAGGRPGRLGGARPELFFEASKDVHKGRGRLDAHWGHAKLRGELKELGQTVAARQVGWHVDFAVGVAGVVHRA
jgi:hypothetical protein